MNSAVQNSFMRSCNLLSLTVFAVCFCLSRFVKLQFADSKLAFSFFLVILLLASSSIANNTDFIRTKMDFISNHDHRWIRWSVKAFGQILILAFATALVVWTKNPRFRVSDQLNCCISATIKQGDLMGLIAAGAFSVYTLSTSMLLHISEEYGLFYLSLGYTMNAAVEMPDIGGHIVNWRYVGPMAIFCFLLIIFRCYCQSSDEVGRRGGNGDAHGDNDNARGPVEFHSITEAGVEPATRDEENQQGDGHDGAEGRGGGGIETGVQGRRDIGGSGTASADKGDEDDDDNDGHRTDLGSDWVTLPDKGKSRGKIEIMSRMQVRCETGASFSNLPPPRGQIKARFSKQVPAKICEKKKEV